MTSQRLGLRTILCSRLSDGVEGEGISGLSDLSGDLDVHRAGQALTRGAVAYWISSSVNQPMRRASITASVREPTCILLKILLRCP